MTQRIGPIRLPVARGWLLLLLAIVLLTVAAYYDRSLKAAPHAGFLPQDRNLTVAVRDLPYCWDTFGHLPTGRALNDGLAVLRQDFEREIRIATGIRPTPARWSTWLGRQILFARSGDAWGLCARPGLLLWFFKRFAPSDDRYGNIHFAWKEGFLLASMDEGWVEAALEGEALDDNRMPRKANVIRIASELGTAMLDIAPGLPFSATVQQRRTEHSDTRSQRLPIIKNALVSVSAKDATTLVAVLTPLLNSLQEIPPWQGIRAGIDERLAQWQTKPEAIIARLERDGAITLSLRELMTVDSIPVPTFTLVQQRRRDSESMHPLHNMLPNATPLPGHWNGIDGYQVPLLGPAFVLCLAADPGYWYTTSRESAMHELTSTPPGQSAEAADASLQINWSSASQTVTPMLREMVKRWENPDYTVSHFDQEWLPLLQDVEGLGRLVFNLKATDEDWTIIGNLDLRLDTGE